MNTLAIKLSSKHNVFTLSTSENSPRSILDSTVDKSEITNTLKFDLSSTKISSTPNALGGGKRIEFPMKDKSNLFDSKIELYTVNKEIGRGSYAVVKELMHKKQSNKTYAVKIYDKKKEFTVRKRRGVMHEVQILKTLDNQNIVQFFGSMEDTNYLYLVFEKVEGESLLEYLRSMPDKKLTEKEARRVFYQIVSAVHYCHSKSVVHRDLKLENILVNNDKNIKVIDFGFSVVANNVCKLNLFCGTALYVAPEIVNRKSYWGPPVDIWSLGVILYVMLSGRFPFKGINESELYKSIARGVYINPKGISENATKLIASLLNQDPDKRPSCEEILKDPFMELQE
jgi:MAP/microtubule affinity-regulating kinase